MASTEERLISAVLKTGDLSTALQEGIDAESMTSFYDEWDWIITYVQDHGRLPSRTAFRAAWPDVELERVNDVGHYAKEVKRERALGLLSSAMDEALGMIQDGYSADRVIMDLQHNMADAERLSSVTQVLSVPHDKELAVNHVRETKERVKKHGYAGIMSGFPTLDHYTGGARPGELWIVGARLGSYKTTTMMRMALAAALEGHKVLFVALEMSKVQVQHRLHILLSQIMRRQGVSKFVLDPTSLRSGDVSLRQYRAWLNKADDFLKGAIDVVDGSHGSMGVAQLRGLLERQHYDIAFLDYLTLFRANVSKQAADWQAVAQLTSDFKNTAVTYELPVVTASQLNRTDGRGKGKYASYIPPSPEGLSRSDSVGQDADYVLLQGKASQHAVRIKMAKSRHTEEGFMWWVHADLKTGTYEEVSQRAIDKVLRKDEDEFLEGKKAVVPHKKGAAPAQPVRRVVRRKK